MFPLKVQVKAGGGGVPVNVWLAAWGEAAVRRGALLGRIGVCIGVWARPRRTERRGVGGDKEQGNSGKRKGGRDKEVEQRVWNRGLE